MALTKVKNTVSELSELKPDSGSTGLYYDENIRFATNSVGGNFYRSTDTKYLEVYGDGNYVIIKGSEDGVPFHLAATNDSSSYTNILNADPDGTTDLFYAGTKKAEINSTGVFSDGSRPIQLNSTSGRVEIKGDSGGWATMYAFLNSAGSRVASFGALGDDTSLTYLYAGKEYNDHGFRIYPDDAMYLGYNETFICYAESTGFLPYLTSTYNLGHGSKLWHTVYASTGTINTSDERQKTTISGTDLGLDFINELNPVSFKFKDYDYNYVDETTGDTISGTNTFHRRHYGLIAQDIKATLSGIGKSTEDFAGYVYDADEDYYALRYQEFIAPIIKAIQELTARVEALEQA